MSLNVHVTWFPSQGRKGSSIPLPSGARADDLLAALDVAPDTVLVVRDGQPVPLDTTLRDGDAIRIVHTVSGG